MAKYSLNSAEDLMALAHTDPRYIIESGFSVINKQKAVVPFIFNDLQGQYYENRTTRDDILKPGQIGFSTMILAILTIKFLLVPNSWSVCISHQEEATKRLFEKVQFFLDHLPDWLKWSYKPGQHTDKGMVNLVMNSHFYIGTAGSRAFARGDTIHYAHFSEVSRWRSAEVATSVIRAVPLDDPNTWIVKETTANGVGNFHHVEYQRAKNKKSRFKSHFFPWFDHRDYKIPGARVFDPDEEERALLRRFPTLTEENLAWRREMIASLNSEQGWTPEEMFKQEFPVDDVEAFLFSGNPVFPVKPLQELVINARPCIWQGNIVGVVPNEKLDETEKGYVKIWEMPKLGEQYIIFGDVGEHTDFCSAHVIDRKTWAIVATFHAQIKSGQFGRELNRLGYFYNTALIAPEANNMGINTIERLIDLDYPNLYTRKRVDKKTKRETSEVGFLTTKITKPLIIGYMQDLIRNGDADIPDIDTLNEMSTFVRHKDGSMGASLGNFDDRVISVMGAYYILKLNPLVAKKATKQNPSEQRAKNLKRLRTRKPNRWRQK